MCGAPYRTMKDSSSWSGSDAVGSVDISSIGSLLAACITRLRNAASPSPRGLSRERTTSISAAREQGAFVPNKREGLPLGAGTRRGDAVLCSGLAHVLHNRTHFGRRLVASVWGVSE